MSDTQPTKTTGNGKLKKAFLSPFVNNWSEAFHYIALSLAIGVSAFWALFTYDAFSKRDRALSELENVQAELKKKQAEIAEIQERLDGNFSSEISIDTQTVALNECRYGLILDVTAKNVGTNDVTLILRNDALTIYKLRYKGDKLASTEKLNPSFYHALSEKPDEKHKIFTSQKLLIGASKNIRYFTELPGPGLYYATFEANPGPDYSNHLKENDTNDYLWFSSKYFHVDQMTCNQ